MGNINKIGGGMEDENNENEQPKENFADKLAKFNETRLEKEMREFDEAEAKVREQTIGNKSALEYKLGRLAEARLRVMEKYGQGKPEQPVVEKKEESEDEKISKKEQEISKLREKVKGVEWKEQRVEEIAKRELPSEKKESNNAILNPEDRFDREEREIELARQIVIKQTKGNPSALQRKMGILDEAQKRNEEKKKSFLSRVWGWFRG